MIMNSRPITVAVIPPVPDVPPEPSMPDGFVELTYIESTGAQYIDTGFKPDCNTRLTACLSMTATSKSLYCIGTGDNTNFIRLFAQSGGTGIQVFYGASNHIFPANMSDRVTIDLNKNRGDVNGTAFVFPVSDFAIGHNLLLFTDNNGGSPNTSRPAKMRLYFCKIFDSTELVRDLIPCRNPDGAAGLYDLAAGKFYPNSGTESFIPGEAVL